MMERFLLGILFFIFSFAISLSTIYTCFKVVIRLTKYNDIKLINQNNVAASLVITGAFVATAIMVKNALYPISAITQDFWLLANKTPTEYLLYCGRAVGFLFLTVILALASVAAALKTFSKLTREISEENEIARNNIAVAILLAGVLLAFAVLIESGIADFVNVLIPVRDMLR